VISMSRSGRTVAFAAIIALVLPMAACSSSPPVTGVRARSSTARSAPVPATSPATTVLTGTQLKSSLVPRSGFPAGYVVNAKYSYHAGDGIRILPTQYDLVTMACATFAQQSGYATWFGQTAMAWAEFDHPAESQGPPGQSYDEFIYQFSDPLTAGSFVSLFRADASRCRALTTIRSGTSLRITMRQASATPVDGDPATSIAMTAVADVGTEQGDFLFVVDDNDVYGVIRIGALTAPPGRPAAAAVIAQMMKQVRAIN
jgi:hypothetical protein